MDGTFLESAVLGILNPGIMVSAKPFASPLGYAVGKFDLSGLETRIARLVFGPHRVLRRRFGIESAANGWLARPPPGFKHSGEIHTGCIAKGERPGQAGIGSEGLSTRNSWLYLASARIQRPSRLKIPAGGGIKGKLRSRRISSVSPDRAETTVRSHGPWPAAVRRKSR